MRNFLILVVVASVFTLVGCPGERSVIECFTDSGQIINIGPNQSFYIALNSNPTTGFIWQVTYDGNMLEMVDKSYKPSEAATQGLVGAGGVEYFLFKALNIGDTEITFVYKREWEEPTPEDITKVFTIRINFNFII